MSPPEGVFHRAPRPLTAWAVTVLVWGLVIFVLIVLAAIALGFWLTAGRGLGVPNLTGGLENFGAVLAALMGAGGLGGLIFGQRHRERMDQQARGLPPGGDPFTQPSSPTPSGGLVNNGALDQQ